MILPPLWVLCSFDEQFLRCLLAKYTEQASELWPKSVSLVLSDNNTFSHKDLGDFCHAKIFWLEEINSVLQPSTVQAYTESRRLFEFCHM